MADKIARTGRVPGRLQQTGVDEWAPEVYTRNSFDAALAMGRAYVLDTGKVDLAVAGNLRIVVQNPPDSNLLVTIHGISGMCTATGWATAHDDPTVGVPTATARPSLRLNRLAGAAPKALLRVDTNATTAMSGGVDTGVAVGFSANNPRSIQLGKILAPGQSFGVNAAFAGSASTALGFFVTEEDL